MRERLNGLTLSRISVGGGKKFLGEDGCLLFRLVYDTDDASETFKACDITGGYRPWFHNIPNQHHRHQNH